ncbi:MAG TPA: bacillithiol biosynthesis deacetylase BshB1 [Ignavibacteria bacterium]|nr:bacillithiol biosynthesis deacetylase BshB1 [Ignavibacteria bacterium]
MQIKTNNSNTSKAKTDALFFAAHPDDAELNCGGTILSLISSGRSVGIVDLTLGELSTRGNLKLRKEETDKASALLGIKFRENLKIADGNIEINLTNKKKLISVIRKYRPEIVFAPYPLDRHPDHINASNLIRESFFYSGLEKIKTGNLEPFRPPKIYYYRNAVDMPVSFIFDISKTFNKKLEVMKCFDSQFYNSDSKEPQTFISSKLFEQEVEARARHFGFKIGVEYGEPFYSDGDLKVENDTLFRI